MVVHKFAHSEKLGYHPYKREAVSSRTNELASFWTQRWTKVLPSFSHLAGTERKEHCAFVWFVGKMR